MEKEYQFGSHKMILNGVIYDEATGTAYMSFEAQDNDGNPVKLDSARQRFQSIYENIE